MAEPKPKKSGNDDLKSDDDWKKIKQADSSNALRGKGNYKVNDVDLTANLPIPQFFTLTDSQKAMFGEFRKASKKCKEAHTDYYICRFLIARKWKLKDSVELFDNAMTWREENKIDEILDTFPDNYWYKALTEYYPNSINPERFHWTKDKCPIFYERIGLVHPKMTDLIPRETLVKHHNYCIELMEKNNHRIAAENGFSPGTILVEDLKDLTHSHMYNKITAMIQEVSASDEQHYPESIRKVYIVNPPGIFGLVWALMKPFIEEQTLQKFAFGTPKDFAAEWDAIIGKENLPKYLGGTLDWDPPKGGDVKHLIPSNLIKKEIGRKEDLVIEATVKKGQTFHWQVICSKDIGIGLFVKTGGTSAADKKVVDGWAVKKYDDGISPHHGWQTATEDCTFILFLDNTDSFFLAREVKYFTYVKDPIAKKK